jgi:hypothetical protein
VARLLGRIVLILGALLLPLWIGAAALGFTPVVRAAVAAVEAPAQRSAPEDPVSMAPADCPDDDATGVAEIDDDDDDADPAEMLPTAGAPRVHASNRSGPARIGRRAGAGPALVHLDVQTPPPRA